MTWTRTFGLPDVEVVGENVDEKLRLLTLTLRQQQTAVPCPACGGVMHWHDRRDLKAVADTPVGAHRVHLVIQRRRARCTVDGCQRVEGPFTPFVQKGYKLTTRLYGLMGTYFRDPGRRFDRVAAEVGVDEKSARRVFSSLALSVEKERVRRTVLGRILRVVPMDVAGHQRYFLINVAEEALADMTDTQDARELKRTLTTLGRLGAPMFVWIPADTAVRSAVRGVFPQARLALARSAVEPVFKEAFKQAQKLPDAELRARDIQMASAVMKPFEASIGDLGEAPRVHLERVAAGVLGEPMAWLAEWVQEWMAELLNVSLLPGASPTPQDSTVQKVKRIVEQLNLMGNGYSYGVLRQRLLFCIAPVWAYEPPPNEGRITYTTGLNFKKDFTMRPGGRRVGRFGISLSEIVAAVDRAALEGPPDLPELPDDDDD